MQIRVHAVEYASRSNGPGLRGVVWVQGCTLGCPGCFNPDTHASNAGSLFETANLVENFIACSADIEGVSISGGEPFQQPAALLDVLERLAETPLSRLVFTGYTLGEINSQPLGPLILPFIDVLIAGRYVASQPGHVALLGSANQKIHRLSDRYTLEDIQRTPPRELILHPDGIITSSGIDPRKRH